MLQKVVFFTASMLICFHAKAQESEIIKSGTYGTNCSYELNDKSVLSIYPTDKSKPEARWTNSYAEELINRGTVKEVIVEEAACVVQNNKNTFSIIYR